MSIIFQACTLLCIAGTIYGAQLPIPKIVPVDSIADPKGSIPYEPCGGSGTTLFVEVDQCSAYTCFFDHTISYEMSIDFRAGFSTNALKYQIYIIIDNEEIQMYDLSAPGQVIGGQAYRISFPVDLNQWPETFGTMRLQVWDDIRDHVAACGSFEALIN